MSRSVALGPIGLALFAGGLYAWARHVATDTTDIVWTTPIAEAVSSDGRWKAIVDETAVEGIVATAIVAHVHLTSTQDRTLLPR